MRAIICIACTFLCSQLVAQPAPLWTRIGPGSSWESGVDPPSLAVLDPGGPAGRSWYSASLGGIWHTADLGSTLRPLPLHGMDNRMVTQMAVAYTSPKILYAVTGNRWASQKFGGDGAYRSTDRGETWTRLPLPYDRFIDPDTGVSELYNLRAVHTSSRGDTVFVASQKHVLRSTDRGSTWTVIIPLPGADLISRSPEHVQFVSPRENLNHISVAVTYLDPQNTGFIARHIKYSLWSHDGGTTWAPNMLDSLTSEYRKTEFSPHTEGVVWAMTEGLVFYRSEDYGQSWVTVPFDEVRPPVYETTFPECMHRGINGSMSGGMWVHPIRPDVVVFGRGAWGKYIDGRLEITLFTGGCGGGITGRSTYIPLAAQDMPTGFRLASQYQVNWLASIPTPAAPWPDYKHTERPRTIPARVEDVCKLPPNTTIRADYRYLAISGGSVVASSFGPRLSVYGWSRTRGGHYFTPHKVHCYRGNLPSGIVTGGYDAEIARADNVKEENSWEMQEHAPRYSRSAPVIISVSSQDHDLVYMAAPGGIYRSRDYAQSWRLVRQHYIPVGQSDYPQEWVHVHSADDNIIYSTGGVSMDGGGNWEQPQTGMRNKRLLDVTARHQTVSHPSDPSTLWACGERSLLRVTDYMQTITEIPLPDQFPHDGCLDLLIFPQDINWMWMGTPTGLWESRDGGNTWKQQQRGLPHVPVTALALSPLEDEVIVGTWGRGIYTVQMSDLEALVTSNERIAELPDDAMQLHGNYPNPFGAETTLAFTAKEPSNVTLEVFDVIGRKVNTVADRYYTRGVHQVRWNPGQIPNGVYFVRMLADGNPVGVQKLVRR